MLQGSEIRVGECCRGGGTLGEIWQSATSALDVMSGRFRPLVFEVHPTSIPPNRRPVNTVALHENTWEQHILLNHPELQGKEQSVQEVAETPSAVYASNSLVTDYLFVKAGVVDSAGRLLRVVVRGGVVVTAYYSSATGGRLVWP
jgi:hypothetical protein